LVNLARFSASHEHFIFFLILLTPFFVFLQLIQSEQCGKAEVQESSSEAEEDDDADNEEDSSGEEGSGDGSSSDYDQDDGEEVSSDSVIVG
jgi:hypothetical protein